MLQVYWVGPVCGAVVATVLYHYILDHIAQAELPADHGINFKFFFRQKRVKSNM